MIPQHVIENLGAIDTAALTVWGEARGESVLGQIAVLWVIRRRSERRHQSVKAVCLAPAQFSCWWEAGGNRDALWALAARVAGGEIPPDPAFLQARYLAAGVLRGLLLDPVDGADHYLTAELYHTRPPSWARGVVPVATVGRHTFLRLEA